MSEYNNDGDDPEHGGGHGLWAAKHDTSAPP